MIVVINKKKIVKNILLLAVLCVSIKGAYAAVGNSKSIEVSSVGTGEKYYISIIIDDFGYSGDGTNEMLALDIPFTAAVMPFSEHTVKDAEAVNSAGKEIIVHMPMESLTGKPSWVGDKAVKTTMTDDEIKLRVNEGLNEVKYAVGINNHMGSKIMEDERSIGAVIDIAAEKDLIFVDSKTTPNSKAEDACSKKGVSYFSRNVFLDSTDDIEVVKRQLLKTADIAIKNGTAIAIGHVGPEGGKITARAIKDLEGQMKEKGIVFVTVTELKKVIENKNK